MYSARTVPPHLHYAELDAFGKSLRKCLEKVVGDELPDRSWCLAQLSIAHGGLGLRDPAKHAPAAYLASLSQTCDLCESIDAEYQRDDAGGECFLRATEAHLRGTVLEAAALDRGGVRLTQKELSGLVDASLLKNLEQDQQHDAFFSAHIALCSLPGAGVWLTAPPPLRTTGKSTRLSSRWLCAGACACQCLTGTRFVRAAEWSWIGGVTMRSFANAEGIVRSATMPCGTRAILRHAPEASARSARKRVCCQGAPWPMVSLTVL